MNYVSAILRSIWLAAFISLSLLLFGWFTSVSKHLLADELPPAFHALTQARLKDLHAALADIGVDTGTKTDKARSMLIYHIGEQSADYDLLGQSVASFKILHVADPTDAELTAYLGSAYILLARDYPWKGLFQIIPGPGFMRLYYVFKGTNLLNDAIIQDPQHPVVRLIRGITMTHMPRVFGNYTSGMEDFSLLHSWINKPQDNLRYVEILKDAAFRSESLFRLAEVYWLDNDLARSRSLFLQAAAAAPVGSPLAVAARALTK